MNPPASIRAWLSMPRRVDPQPAAVLCRRAPRFRIAAIAMVTDRRSTTTPPRRPAAARRRAEAAICSSAPFAGARRSPRSRSPATRRTRRAPPSASSASSSARTMRTGAGARTRTRTRAWRRSSRRGWARCATTSTRARAAARVAPAVTDRVLKRPMAPHRRLDPWRTPPRGASAARAADAAVHDVVHLLHPPRAPRETSVQQHRGVRRHRLVRLARAVKVRKRTLVAERPPRPTRVLSLRPLLLRRRPPPH